VSDKSLTIQSSESLLSKCLNVFKGIFNTLSYHAIDHRLRAILILNHLWPKTHTKMIKRALKDCNGGEKREYTFGQLKLNSLKARDKNTLHNKEHELLFTPRLQFR